MYLGTFEICVLESMGFALENVFYAPGMACGFIKKTQVKLDLLTDVEVEYAIQSTNIQHT